MPSKEAAFFNEMFANMPKTPEGQPHDFAEERRGDRNRPKANEYSDVTISEYTLAGIHGELLTPQGNEARKGQLLWYIHGGGFTTGAASERREITTYLCHTYGFTVAANDYRLAPEHHWPAALDDCLSYYRSLLDEGWDPAQMVFMGESAGGTLVLSLALKLKELEMPGPKAIAAFSPCVNQAEGYPSHRNNAKTDVMLGDAVGRSDQNEAVWGSPSPDLMMLRDPLISPVYGDWFGLPPVFLAASDVEALRDDAVEMYQKLKSEGYRTMLDIQHDVFHAYPMLPVVPEARDTIEKAVRFIDETDVPGRMG